MPAPGANVYSFIHGMTGGNRNQWQCMPIITAGADRRTFERYRLCSCQILTIRAEAAVFKSLHSTSVERSISAERSQPGSCRSAAR